MIAEKRFGCLENGLNYSNDRFLDKEGVHCLELCKTNQKNFKLKRWKEKLASIHFPELDTLENSKMQENEDLLIDDSRNLQDAKLKKGTTDKKIILDV